MVEPETIDDLFILINGFLQGFNAVQFFPNAPECSKYSQIFMNEDNATWIDINSNPDRAELDQVRMVTKLVSNQFAEAYLYCGNTLVDMYIYVLSEIEIYVTAVNWLQAFLQNLIGKSLDIQKLVKNIIKSSEAGD